MTPVESDDPLYVFACEATLHFMRTYIMMHKDPPAFEEFKTSAPADWAFASIEDRDEEDGADWWKTVP
jgi:hypothetical protein